MIPLILVAEQDPAAGCVIELALRQRVPCRVSALRYGYEVLEAVARQEDVALIIVDAGLPDMNGPEVITQLKRLHGHIPVIAAVAARDEALIKTCLKAGAVDYLRKSDSPQRIASVVKHVLTGWTGQLQAPQPTASDAFSDMVGTSAALKDAVMQARKASQSDIPVLLKGESGVGKERFARAIHQTSGRRRQPFVAVNCGAIPPNLVESTLFGHEKGAFTGAVAAADGLFRQAQGGTLFLDEIGELPKDAQVKLLRTLQEKEVMPVGGKVPVPVDVRIISATHVDLERAVADGHFRDDLYYRLHVFPIEIPPLRKRGKNDIVALASYFTDYFAGLEGKSIHGIAPAAVELLTGYNWPGNIRQLENAIYRAVVSAADAILGTDDFIAISNALQQRHYEQESRQASPKQLPVVAVQERKYVVALVGDGNEFKSLSAIEGEVLHKAMVYYRWHITNIARALGLTRATVYKKMKLAGIIDPRERGDVLEVEG